MRFGRSGYARKSDVLVEAHRLRHGPRQASYGDPSDAWAQIADVWSVLAGVEITPERAVLMMAAMKTVRATRRHDRDDLIDAIAYLAIADDLR